MIDIQLLRKDIATVAERLATRKFQLDVAGFNALEAERKAIQTRTEELQGKRNALSKFVYRKFWVRVGVKEEILIFLCDIVCSSYIIYVIITAVKIVISL